MIWVTFLILLLAIGGLAAPLVDDSAFLTWVANGLILLATLVLFGMQVAS